jgi:hypothetical protein
MSDFVLFDNRFGAFRSLFPVLGEVEGIMFSEYLVHLAANGADVRLITTRTDTSERFLSDPRLRGAMAAAGPAGGTIEARHADEHYHEKGILAQSFYVEGSMNITHHGVLIRGEKVTYHTVGETGQNPKIAAAYLEFDRRWSQLR